MPEAKWSPAVKLDLNDASAAAFEEVVTAFKKWDESCPRQSLTFTNGWHTITPQMAESLLRHNPHNRKVSFRTVQKYAAAMANGSWKRTGQAILINQDGVVQDCQHRAWACYLSGVSFPSYVVADVPVEADLFAFIDDSKPRSAADALYTSGNNGLSPIVAGAVKLANRYDNYALSIMSNTSKCRDLTNPEVLEYCRQNPGLNHATHIMMANYANAAKVIGNKHVAAFFAWKVIEHYGQDVLDDFFVPLGTGANLDEDDPILGLRNRLFSRLNDPESVFNIAHRLALVTKAFQMHLVDAKVKKGPLSVKDTDKFPRIEPIPAAKAA